MKHDGRSEAIGLLLQKQKSLLESGTDRLPQRSDFSETEVVFIKSQLGAFPRALEAAGLKPCDPDAAEKKLKKRIAARRRRTAEKVRKKQQGEESL